MQAKMNNSTIGSKRLGFTFPPATMALAFWLLFGIANSQGTDFTWASATSGDWTISGNWDESGHPQATTDTAAIAADGGGTAYTVSLNANKTVGSLTVGAADAQLAIAGGNTLSIDNGGSGGSLAHTAGALNGTYYLLQGALSLAGGATPTGTALFRMRYADGTFAGTIEANQTLQIESVVSDVARGATSVTSTGGFTNAGTINMNTNAYYGHLNNTQTLTLNSGTLTNQGLIHAYTYGASSYAPTNAINADLLNTATGTITVSHAVDSSGSLRLTKPGAAHANRGNWSASRPVVVVGNATSFVQDKAAPEDPAPSLTTTGNGSFTMANVDIYGGGTPGAANSFTASAGDLAGNFIFQHTQVTLGAGVNIPTATIFVFQGEDKTKNTFTGDIPANLTVQLHNPGISEGSIVNTTGNLANNGTLSIHSTGAGFNAGYGQLNVNNGAGTLTNYGTLTAHTNVASWSLTSDTIAAQVVNHGSLTLQVTNNHATHTGYTVLNGDVTNEAGGTVEIVVAGTSANKDVRFVDGAAGTFINRGAFNVVSGNLNLMGGTLQNQAGGTLTVDGSLTGTVTNAPGALLAGGGTVTGNVVSTGSIAPGSSAGSLAIGGDLTHSGTLLIELGGFLQDSEYDWLDIAGTADLSGGIEVSLIDGFSGKPYGTTFEILTAGTLIDSGLSLAPASATWFSLTVDTSGGRVLLTSLIPEPTSLSLLALAGLAAMRRRRQATQQENRRWTSEIS